MTHQTLETFRGKLHECGSGQEERFIPQSTSIRIDITDCEDVPLVRELDERDIPLKQGVHGDMIQFEGKRYRSFWSTVMYSSEKRKSAGATTKLDPHHATGKDIYKSGRDPARPSSFNVSPRASSGAP